MFKNIEAVIFDMDGTIIDSMWIWKSVDIEYLKQFGLDVPKDLNKAIEGMSFSETAAYFKNRFNIDQSIDEIKGEWNRLADVFYREEVTLKDHVLGFLDALKSKGIKMGIGTSNSMELVDVIMKRFGLREYFDSIRTSCEVDNGKPFPDIFLKVAEDLGIEPEKCIVFEDIPNGIQAGKRANMSVVAVYDAFSKKMTVEKKELADYYIDSYDEVINELKQL